MSKTKKTTAPVTASSSITSNPVHAEAKPLPVVIDADQTPRKRKPTQAAVGAATAEFAALKEQEAVLKIKIDKAAENLKGLLVASDIDAATVVHGGVTYSVSYKQGAASPPTLVTQAMVGTLIGGKAGSRPLIVKRVGAGEAA